MVLLKVEPSESFARSVEVEVSVDIAEESVDALLAQISEKISVKVTELFAWYELFEPRSVINEVLRRSLSCSVPCLGFDRNSGTMTSASSCW